MQASIFFDFEYTRLLETPNGRFWFMSMPVPDGSRIAGCCPDKNREQKLWQACFDSGDAADIVGKRVLDIGANDGYFSLAARLAGARSVTAINTEQLIHGTYPENLRYAARLWDVDLEILTGDFLELEPARGLYDTILFFGVFYHVENIFAALKKLRSLLAPGGSIYLETQVSSLRLDRPIVEIASDTFRSTTPQHKQVLHTLGNSNYLLPNDLAIYSLCDAYELTVRRPGPNAYESDFANRQLFVLARKEAEVPRRAARVAGASA